jgi:oligopeptide transport system ATP-binding protein
MALLEVTGLQVKFNTPEGEVQAVNGLDFSVDAGESLAIVGESGAGKSQAVMAIMGLLAENGSATGKAEFKGQDLMQMSRRELNKIRGCEIAMIFQDPMTSLNPFLTIEKQMVEVIRQHQKLRRDEARAHAVEMLRAVRIPAPEERIKQYPHEFSGGMRQRVMIAMGLLCEPSLLIADEPTTALDVTVQAQITQLVGELREKSNMSLILITHDLAVVAEVCDRILVMYAGQVVETGSADDIFYRPQHPYTQGLLASVPRMDQPVDDELHSIPGNPPNLTDLGSGCHFRERCSKAMDVCKDDPPLQEAQDGRMSRCFIAMANGEMVNVGVVGGDMVGDETGSGEDSTEIAE